MIIVGFHQISQKICIETRFKNKEIKLGLYARNLNKYEFVYNESLESKSKKFPKNFIYVGRYLELKGVYDLLDAFDEFSFTNRVELTLYRSKRGKAHTHQKPYDSSSWI